MEKKQRIVIIGAGPTGLGVAYRLYELGVLRSKTQVVILEQTSDPGGLANSYRDKHGFVWDNGGNGIFSHYSYFDHVLDKVVPKWKYNSTAAYAYMLGSSGKRRFVPYYFQSSIHSLEKDEQENSLVWLEDVVGYRNHQNVSKIDEWLVKNLREKLCEAFMGKYNSTLWRVDPSDMKPFWMPSDCFAVPKVISNTSGAKVRLHNETVGKKWSRNPSFQHSHYGDTGAIWKSIANLLPQGWFHYNQKVTMVDSEKKVLYVQDSQKSALTYHIKYNYLISTAPLDMLLSIISDLKKSEFRRKSSSFVYSRIHIIGIGLHGHPPDFLVNKSCIYFPDSDSVFYRVTVHSANDMDPLSGTHWSLLCEAAEPQASHLSAYQKDSLIESTLKSLVNYEFIKRENIITKHYRHFDRGYAVPFVKRDELLGSIQPWLESRSIYSRGHLGGWRYEVGNQDHSFMQGVEVADLIMLGIPEETYPKPNHVNSFKGSDRTVSCTPPLPVGPEYEFVVTHYKENLKWMERHADHCHVYDKNEVATAMNLKFYQWERLPNVGRESHTHLHHIIANYHHLADITVFLQGSLKHHQFSSYHDVTKYVQETKKKGFSVYRYKNLTHWGRIHHVSKWKIMMDTGSLRPANQTLGEFWESMFGSQHPDQVQMSYAGCFGVSKERIKAHPKEFYENLIQYVNNHDNPEETHYIERFWVAIFENTTQI